MVATILYLGANPASTPPIDLGQEAREIKLRLRSAAERDSFKVEPELAVRTSDLQDLLQHHLPTIVHFGSHGSSAGRILLGGPAVGSRPMCRPGSPLVSTTHLSSLRGGTP